MTIKFKLFILLLIVSSIGIMYTETQILNNDIQKIYVIAKEQSLENGVFVFKIYTNDTSYNTTYNLYEQFKNLGQYRVKINSNNEIYAIDHNRIESPASRPFL